VKKVLVIAGVTGVGKSKLGVTMAKLFNGEIISGDSVAVYKELTVGSAKISKDEMEGIAHYGMNVLTLEKEYNVRDFQEYARQKIDEIVSRGKLPIVVGGSGLYIRALLYDYVFHSEKTLDMSWTETLTNAELHEQLKAADPIQAEIIHENNRKRVIRALSIIRSTQQSKSELLSQQSQSMIYDAMVFACTMPREMLYDRLNQRVDHMVHDGLLDEVELAASKAGWNHPAMMAIGYKEFKEYFEGKISLDDAVALVQRNTRRFAKRQMTWFKHQMPCRWLDMSLESDVESAINEVREWMNH
jgi:tRNA dimethylallyltransferase